MQIDGWVSEVFDAHAVAALEVTQILRAAVRSRE
jgi:hypothetical protein